MCIICIFNIYTRYKCIFTDLERDYKHVQRSKILVSTGNVLLLRILCHDASSTMCTYMYTHVQFRLMERPLWSKLWLWLLLLLALVLVNSDRPERNQKAGSSQGHESHLRKPNPFATPTTRMSAANPHTHAHAGLGPRVQVQAYGPTVTSEYHSSTYSGLQLLLRRSFGSKRSRANAGLVLGCFIKAE